MVAYFALSDLVESRWRQYAARTVEIVDGLSLGETARLASAFSTARLLDFGLMASLSSRALECLRAEQGAGAASATAADARRLAMAFGRARAFDSDLMEALVPIISERVEDFRPRELARVADAYARAAVQSPDLFALAAEALPPYLYDLEPGDLAALCRGFSEAAVYSSELTDALCEEVVKRLKSFGPLECLVFLEGLAQLSEGLPEEMRRDDAETVAAVAGQLARSMQSLAAGDIVRVFSALVQLDHYDQFLVHARLCEALAQKLSQGQLRGPPAFARLAELLHCLSLLPAQSHKSAELALTTAALLRECGPPRGGRPEPRALALVASALAELGQQDQDLLEMLGGAVLPRPSAGLPSDPRHGAGPSELLALSSDDELQDLQRAFRACRSEALAGACAAIGAELARRSE
ncbi:unnamed protein product [Prorocentrum cordatum]|uniref:Uncharacterized protein n=1 Tax=Prorocentrum cordatum TaxID=2364126 RepID=A0ABN9RU56_9DINO|nr:unnamed protein product [Polarella glacialis]